MNPLVTTPDLHAASHASGGGDAVALGMSQITGLQTALDAKASLASAEFVGTVDVSPTNTASSSLRVRTITSQSGRAIAILSPAGGELASVNVFGQHIAPSYFANADGTANSPVFSRSADQNTGIYFSSPDTLSISAGGVERMGVSAAGVDISGKINATNAVKPGAFTVATLPTTGIAAGSLAHASNGRKSGEGASAGTGCPVWYDGTNWKTYYDNTTVQA